VFSEGVTCVTTTDVPSQLLAGSEDKSVLLFDWSNSQQLCRWKAHKRGVRTLQWHRQTNAALSGARDGSIRMWQRGHEESLMEIEAHKLVVSALALSQSTHHLASGSRDCAVGLWDLSTGQNVALTKLPRNLVTGMCHLSGSSTFLQTSEDLHIRLWDERTMKVSQDIQTATRHFPLCCDASEDGNYFVVGNNGFSSSGQFDGCEARVWDVRNLKEAVCEYRGHSQSVNSCAFVQHNSTLMVATGSKDKSLQLWDSLTGELQGSCSQDDNLTITGIAPQCINGRTQLMVANMNGTIQVWELDDFSLPMDDRLRLCYSTAALGPCN